MYLGFVRVTSKARELEATAERIRLERLPFSYLSDEAETAYEWLVNLLAVLIARWGVPARGVPYHPPTLASAKERLWINSSESAALADAIPMMEDAYPGAVLSAKRRIVKHMPSTDCPGLIQRIVAVFGPVPWDLTDRPSAPSAPNPSEADPTPEGTLSPDRPPVDRPEAPRLDATKAHDEAPARPAPSEGEPEASILGYEEQAVAVAYALQKEGRRVSIKTVCDRAGLDRSHLYARYPNAIRAIRMIGASSGNLRRGSKSRDGTMETVDWDEE